MNKYASFFICLFCLGLLFACASDGSTSAGTTANGNSGKQDVLGTKNPAEMSQAMKNLDGKDRQALDKIAALQKQVMTENKKGDKKNNANEVTYVIGEYDDTIEARSAVEGIFRIEYKIKPVTKRTPNGLQVLAKCRFKDKAELAKMETALKSKFGNDIRRLKSTALEETEG